MNLRKPVRDIREHQNINHGDIVALNFIRSNATFYFRRHYRHGLRSHIMELLSARDRRLENEGQMEDGVRSFPRAQPRRMLRLFRRQFESVEQAIEEIRRLQILDRYLSTNFYAPSDEFIVDYWGPEGFSLMLCGLQEYVSGEDLDPWHHNPANQLSEICRRLTSERYDPAHLSRQDLCARIRRQADRFIRRIKQMALEANYLPDLAGIGNILVTAAGQVKLVDINNISRLWFDHHIRVDDKGYPVCDKSIEALALLEEHITGKVDLKHDPVYRHFFDPQRMQKVKRLEQAFNRALKIEVNS
jgi:hypothetical protein